MKTRTNLKAGSVAAAECTASVLSPAQLNGLRRLPKIRVLRPFEQA